MLFSIDLWKSPGSVKLLHLMVTPGNSISYFVEGRLEWSGQVGWNGPLQIIFVFSQLCFSQSFVLLVWVVSAIVSKTWLFKLQHSFLISNSNLCDVHLYWSKRCLYCISFNFFSFFRSSPFFSFCLVFLLMLFVNVYKISILLSLLL